MTWRQVHKRKGQPVTDLDKSTISPRPGVYVFYRKGAAVYVGKATSLKSRVGANHLGHRWTDSALRRNVAEHLGIASSADLKTQRYEPTAREAKRVADWLRACDVVLIVCATVAAAENLEDKLKREWKPPLTKR